MRLEGRTALVTGGAGGIGAATARRLAAEGARVAVGDLALDGAREVAAEIDGFATDLDVTDTASVGRAVAAVTDALGPVDLLVNNAGVRDQRAVPWEADPADWWRTIEVNVRGPYLMTHALWPHLAASGGRVVNLSSGAAYRNSDVATAYNVGKGALARITAAVGLGPDPAVPTFDLAPGVVRTDMTLSMKAHEGRTEWTAPGEVTDLLLGLASGALDAWSGRLVRAGVDTVASLQARAELGLGETDRTLGLLRWGEDDPLT